MTGNTGGASSWINEIKGPRELVRRMRVEVDSKLSVIQRGYDSNFYRNGNRILFKTPSWTIEEFRKFLAGSPKLGKVVCASQWVLTSSSELSFELDTATCGAFGANAVDKLAEVEGALPRTAMAQLQDRGTGEILHPVIESKDLGGLGWSDAKLRRVTAGEGREAFMLEFPDADYPDAERPIDPDPASWENRFVEQSQVTFDGRAHPLFTMAKPLNEGSRRTRYLQEFLSSARERSTVWLDAGNMVEESDPARPGDQALELRKISWEAAARLKLAGLVPGRNELMAGISGLEKEAGQAGIPLVSANLMKNGKPAFRPFLIVERGGRRMGLVGITDPEITDTLPAEKLEDSGIAPPLEPVRAAVEELYKESGGNLDLVVVLGNLTGASRRDFLPEIQGVDLILLADDQAGRDSEWAVRLEASPDGDSGGLLDKRGRHRESLYTGSIYRLGPELVRATFKNPGGYPLLQDILLQPMVIRESQDRDEAVSRGVSLIRQKTFDEGSEILLPDVDPIIKGDPLLLMLLFRDPDYRHLSDKEKTDKDFPAVLTSDLWSRLAASALRRVLQVDAAIVPNLPLKYGAAGPIPRLFCKENVPPTITVLRADLPGSVIEGILAMKGVQASGISADHMIEGRSIQSEEWYRVALTADVWDAASIPGGAAQARFVKLPGPKAIYRPDPKGEALTLRQAVLSYLEARKSKDPSLGPETQKALAQDLKPGGDEIIPRWYVDVNKFSLQTTSWYPPAKDTKYELDCPDCQRATTGRHLTQNYMLDLRMSRHSAAVVWDLGTRLAYSRSHFEDQDQELEDQIRVENGFAFPKLGRSIGGGIDLAPTAILSLDTEMTPKEDESGLKLDRRMQYNGTLACAVSGWGSSYLALGLTWMYDVPEEKGSAGVEFDFHHSLSFKAMVWENAIESRYYFKDKKEDTASSTGFYAKWRTSLRVPFIRNLYIDTFLDVLAYRGKVPETHKMGISTMLGVQVSFTRLRWKPGWESFLH